MFICARTLAGPPEDKAVPAIALDLLVYTARLLALLCRETSRIIY